MTLTSFPPPDPSTVARGVAPSAPAEAPGPALPRSLGRSSAPSPEPPRRITPLVLVLGGLAIAMVLLAAAALPILQGDDAEPTGAGATTAPPSTLALRPAPIESTVPAAPESTTAPETPVTTTAETVAPPVSTEAPASSEVPTTVAVAVPPPVVEEVPESKAVVRGGQIFLEGAVPTVEAGVAIATLAAEILGPDNVFNNYTVDPRASDPNLGNVTVEDTINFDSGSAVILPESEGLLNQALALMTIRPSVTVIVVGHTDDRGSDLYNLALSEQRALAVKTWLTDRGIDGARLTVVGKGEFEPIADNLTPEGQRLNRRIQFFIENLLADS